MGHLGVEPSVTTYKAVPQYRRGHAPDALGGSRTHTVEILSLLTLPLVY